MTGLRHIAKGTVHKERHQPAARKKYVAILFCVLNCRFGILEKKKDFQRRAKHLHKKKSYIDNLREKAFLRNPEEFAYGMIKGKTNSIGQVDLGRSKEANPNAVKAKPDFEAKRQRVREAGTDGKGSVHKYSFERRR